MALSTKAQINIKLETAKRALESSLQNVSAQLEGKSREEIRNDPELYRLSLLKHQYEIQIAGIYKLFAGGAKKQSARLILAFCTGNLRDGSPCDYKIRASMSTYLRGVPCCPDAMCDRKAKPFEIEIKDENLNAEIDNALSDKDAMQIEVEHAHFQKERDLKRARENGMRGFAKSPEQVLPHERGTVCEHGTKIGEVCVFCLDDKEPL